MKLYSLVCAVTVVVAAMATESQAQVILHGPYGPVAQPSTPMYSPMPGGIVGSPVTPGYPGYPSYYPGYQRPSVPVYVTPEQYNGYNPQTGGFNTRNTQVNNTRYDYGRDGSRYNGTSRQVRRPVYDSYGRIVGYQEGEVWNNSVTGQEHGNLNTVTPNDSGGVQETATLYSTAAPQK